jgi:hypothetical protein
MEPSSPGDRVADPAAARASRSYVRVFGRVVEDSTGIPLAGVRLEAVREGTGPERRAQSGSDGRFSMLLPPGRYVVRARRIGFAERATETLDLRRPNEGVTVELRLVPVPAVLGTVAVEARAAAHASAMEGFARRRRLGQGIFLDFGGAARRDAPALPHLLRGLAGVQVSGGYQPVVTMTRAAPGCFPVVYLDGTRISGAHDAAESVRGVLGMIPGGDVEAIEVYRGPSETPGEFGGLAAPCGAIAVWSRQPTPR